jgi:hypothetical protein
MARLYCLQINGSKELEQELINTVLNEPYFQDKCHLDINEVFVNFKEEIYAQEAVRFLRDRLYMTHPTKRAKISYDPFD